MRSPWRKMNRGGQDGAGDPDDSDNSDSDNGVNDSGDDRRRWI